MVRITHNKSDANHSYIMYVLLLYKHVSSTFMSLERKSDQAKRNYNCHNLSFLFEGTVSIVFLGDKVSRES